MRVQIPVYTDRWMMGDRYGEVVKALPARKDAACQLPRYRVKLDKSGKTINVIADDCEEV